MSLIILIVGMSLVTMIPRIVPVYIVDRVSFPPWLQLWFKGIPFAALGALIFPGILSIEKNNISVGIVGGLVALILSALRLHILFVVFGAIGAVYIMKLYFI